MINLNVKMSLIKKPLYIYKGFLMIDITDRIKRESFKEVKKEFKNIIIRKLNRGF